MWRIWRFRLEDYSRRGTPRIASGLYGASGTAIGNEGNLLRSNLHGDSMTKVDRKGQAKPFATSGLSGPVGSAIDRKIEGYLRRKLPRQFAGEDLDGRHNVDVCQECVSRSRQLGVTPSQTRVISSHF